MPTALRLKGQLDVRAFEQALTEIVRRHEALRTTFPEVDGQPVQVFAPPLRDFLPLIDLTELEPAEREHEAGRLAEAEAQLPFDLSNGPLLRAERAAIGRRRPCRIADDAPHRFGWMVHGRLAARVDDALRSVRRWP